MIGADADTIDKAEDRNRFDKAMKNIGLECPRAEIAHTLEEAFDVQTRIGFPAIIRPSFTMGGSGGGIAYNREEFEEICIRGLDLSPTSELLIDESLIGWKEYEMEVVRDTNDNCIIICAIENFDAMGVHTGDSITVAPAQTLTDKEYQIMRNASLAVLREIGVETGGSNVQFGVNPEDGRMVVIEMNPRVSRSSALASKATGFPIARVAAKLAVGYTLDELQNEITGGATPASFEPAIDYVVTKIPRFTFEKFPQADDRLTTQMKSVGEVMAIGRTFQESLQKALRGLETGIHGLDPILDITQEEARSKIVSELKIPRADRIQYVGDALRMGMEVQEVYEYSGIDPWFLVQLQDLIQEEAKLATLGLADLNYERVYSLKRKGFSDIRLATLLGLTEKGFRQHRQKLGIRPVYKRVDTCAAEFSTDTAYMYSTYEEECESRPTGRDKIMILGGGPNRIGQGIEFDYCCVHAALTMRKLGYETIMVNCNPETVSTDYDTSDRLYFESVTLEDVLEIVQIEQPMGVIVQYGGQTPLKLAVDLENAGVPILGTSPEAIDRAEDRERFQQMIQRLGLLQPENATVRTQEEAVRAAEKIGYPLVVRPSYVLGGRAMEIVHQESELKRYMNEAVQVSHDSPVLLDRFLSNAVEVDIDAVCDGEQVVIGAIMQHIEQAGIHSGDSACALPPYDLPKVVQDAMREQVKRMALELGVIGLMNTQLAWQDGEIYVIEVNPRASRTVPFVSKCIGVSLADIGAQVMAGKSLADIGFTEEIIPGYFSVKEAVFPFDKFPGVDPILSPEMKSTGEVMGVGNSFAEAFSKAHIGTGQSMPVAGKAFVSVREVDKPASLKLAAGLVKLGFTLVATSGTQKTLTEAGFECERVNKVMEGRPNIVDKIKNDEITFVVNTTEGRQAINDSSLIRRSALQHKVAYSTTLTGGLAVMEGLAFGEEQEVRRLQDMHATLIA
jgi:carbamoyl-phosphate synthase large subunit